MNTSEGKGAKRTVECPWRRVTAYGVHGTGRAGLLISLMAVAPALVDVAILRQRRWQDLRPFRVASWGGWWTKGDPAEIRSKLSWAKSNPKLCDCPTRNASSRVIQINRRVSEPSIYPAESSEPVAQKRMAFNAPEIPRVFRREEIELASFEIGRET
jgi:hypothetical protein